MVPLFLESLPGIIRVLRKGKGSDVQEQRGMNVEAVLEADPANFACIRSTSHRTVRSLAAFDATT